MNHRLTRWLLLLLLLGCPAWLLQGATITGRAGDGPLYLTGTDTLDVKILMQDGVQVLVGGSLIGPRANQALAAATVIQHASRRDVIEIVQISSNTTSNVTSSANPRIAAGLDGQIIFLQGTSATNTYTIPDGQGVKWATGSSVVFDDRTSRVLTYITSLGAWREGVTFTGGGGGGGTAASTSFNPTGGLAAANVQTALAEVDAEAEKVANKGAASGYMGLTAGAKGPWNQMQEYGLHPALSAGSSIDAATMQRTIIGVESTGGNVTLTSSPRITGCTAPNTGIRLLLVGVTAGRTVTLQNGNGLLLPGATGSVVVGVPPNGGPAEFRCNGATTTWELTFAAGLQIAYQGGRTILGAADSATSFQICDSANGNCTEIFGSTIRGTSGGAAIDNIQQLAVGKKFCVRKSDSSDLFCVANDTGAITGANFGRPVLMASLLNHDGFTTGYLCNTGGGINSYAQPVGSTFTDLPHSPRTEADIGMVMPKAADIKNLRVKLAAALPASETLIITVRKNQAAVGSPAALSCTITAGNSTCSDTTNTATFAVGDQINHQVNCAGAVTNPPSTHISVDMN
jgi:hypothetical protein